jgi:hypothetical protein
VDAVCRDTESHSIVEVDFKKSEKDLGDTLIYLDQAKTEYKIIYKPGVQGVLDKFLSDAVGSVLSLWRMNNIILSNNLKQFLDYQMEKYEQAKSEFRSQPNDIINKVLKTWEKTHKNSQKGKESISINMEAMSHIREQLLNIYRASSTKPDMKELEYCPNFSTGEEDIFEEHHFEFRLKESFDIALCYSELIKLFNSNLATLNIPDYIMQRNKQKEVHKMLDANVIELAKELKTALRDELALEFAGVKEVDPKEFKSFPIAPPQISQTNEDLLLDLLNKINMREYVNR